MFNKKITNKGFTIIEVLIVLTIASAILLVVFLSVPALQRNNRNNSYRQEAQRILGGAQENISNNGGNLLGNAVCALIVVPPATPGTGNCNYPGTPASPANDATKIMLLANPKNYDSLTIEPCGSALDLDCTVGGGAPTFAKAVIKTTAKCGTGPKANIAVGGAGRQIALLYMIEDSAGKAIQQCVNS